MTKPDNPPASERSDATQSDTRTPARDPAAWEFKQPYGWKLLLGLVVASILLGWSAHRTELDKATGLAAQGVADAIGVRETSSVGTGARRFFENAFPFELASETEVSRIPDFDPDNLPLGARVEDRPERVYNAMEDRWDDVGTRQVLIRPYGYLVYVGGLMLKTLEIAVWGTIVATLMGIPLAYLNASNLTQWSLVRTVSRGFCSFSRAIPELVAAMFLVLMFGFGPAAGVLALGFHCAGFLGKFYADDIENIDRGPSEALRCAGANKLKVFRYAILPQVLPQWLAYTNYILERNVRSATVIGIVGAGGIGVELWGRWDLSDFRHVSTILLVIFITVFVIEHLTQRVRTMLIG